MAAEMSVDELIGHIQRGQGRETHGVVVELLQEGGSELAQRLADALPALHGEAASAVCWALGAIGPEARVALPALEEVARRRSALVLRALEASAAERAVVAIRADEPQFVLDALQSMKSDLRSGALHAIASGGVTLSDAQVQSVAERLTAMLGGREWSVAAHAVAALAALGPPAAAAVPRLTELATAEDPPTDPAGIQRLVYVEGLGSLGRAGIEVGPTLAKLLTDPNELVRGVAMRLLRQVGPQSGLALAPLLAALAFESPPVGMMGPGYESWPEAMQQSARDGLEEARLRHEAEVRATAAWALGELGEPNERVLSALAGACGSTAARLRYHAVTALGRIGHASDEVATALCRTLAGDRTSHVRRAAARALGLIADASDACLSALTTALADTQTRKSAAWAVGRFSEAAFDCAPALINAFDANERRRRVIVRALIAVGPMVIHDLLQGLHRDDRWHRIGCAEAVAALGRAGRAAEPTLRELLFDRRRDVQEAAQEALEAISDNEQHAADPEGPAEE